MIDETVVLLIPSQDYSKHKLSKYIRSYLGGDYSFKKYYYEPLQKLFSKVVVYDYVARMTKIGISAFNKELIALVAKERPKYVIWCTMHHEILESTFSAIRKLGTKVVGIFFDDEWRFDEYSRWWIPYIDYFVTNDLDSVPKYNTQGAKVFQTVACNGTPIKRDWSNITEKYDVSFVGYPKFDREKHIAAIKKENISLSLFGGWGKHVSHDEMLEIFKTSKINLNFSKTYLDRPQLKGRVFEVTMAGGFLLTEYVPGLENYFRLDEEIVYFQNPRELVSKIKYYLAHDKKRRAIAKKGWKRAMKDYTPLCMFSRIFKWVEQQEGQPQLQTGDVMSRGMRKKFSNYYLHWAIALSLENYEKLWRDALRVSLSYNPFNILAWLYGPIGLSPPFIRLNVVRPMIKSLVKPLLKVYKMCKNISLLKR